MLAHAYARLSLACAARCMYRTRWHTVLVYAALSAPVCRRPRRAYGLPRRQQWRRRRSGGECVCCAWRLEYLSSRSGGAVSAPSDRGHGSVRRPSFPRRVVCARRSVIGLSCAPDGRVAAGQCATRLFNVRSLRCVSWLRYYVPIDGVVRTAVGIVRSRCRVVQQL